MKLAYDLCKNEKSVYVTDKRSQKMKEKRVLIVEDDEDLRFIILMNLEELDLEFTVAHSGNKAIELLNNGLEVDLIISDYSMPDGDGGMLLDYLLESGLSIPFILFTNTLSPYIPPYKMLLGTLPKFDFDSLEKLIKETLLK